jgi:hypothetical protein
MPNYCNAARRRSHVYPEFPQNGKSASCYAPYTVYGNKACRGARSTRIGTDTVTEEQWYLGLLEELGEQLDLDNDPLEFWEQYAHLGFSHRFIRYVEHMILAEFSGQITIFIDEIDAILSLKFPTDDFFAAIRQLYNARAQNSALYRLGFVLIGVATPNDLIADPNRPPFNIGDPLN